MGDFDITDLRMAHFVKSGAHYFRPTATEANPNPNPKRKGLGNPDLPILLRPRRDSMKPRKNLGVRDTPCTRMEEREEEESLVIIARSSLPALISDAGTTRCRVAPTQTNPRCQEGEPHRWKRPAALHESICLKRPVLFAQ